MTQDSLRAGHRSGDAIADRRADYAASLAEEGDPAAAADLMRQALERAPDWAAGWVRLGGHLEGAGALVDAAAAYRAAMAIDAADGHGAGLKLAALGAAPTPDAAPAAFVRGLFDQYAESFEASLVDRLGYGVPDKMMAALRGVGGPAFRAGDALDLGCGTGLMGERLRPVASWLTGVDLSSGMLAKARRKGVYDRLVEANILRFDAGDQRFDLVTAADVLIYVGGLRGIFETVARLLRPGGRFAFSLEAHAGEEPFVLRPSLRFAHSAAYVRALAEAGGFASRYEAPITVRLDRGEPVAGMLFIVATR